MIRFKEKIILLLVSAVVLYAWSDSYSQDSQNWNIPYGTYSTLLGGAVIGSAYDLSASYYNPGMIAIYKSPGISIGAKLYKYTVFKINPASKSQEELSSSSLNPVPGFVTGTLGHDTTSSDYFSYSLLGKQIFNANLESKSNSVINNNNVFERFYLSQHLSEYWGGITYSKGISRHFGIGISNYVAFREQNFEYNISNYESQNYTVQKSYNNEGQTKYFNFRLLWKIGLAFKYNNFTSGLTITTPGIHIYGSGNVYTLESNNILNNSVFLETNYQENQRANFRSGMSAGWGFSYNYKPIKFHFSFEWYDAVRPYDIIETKPYEGQTSNNIIYYDLKQSFNSIINYGFGLELIPESRYQLYISYITDRSTIGGSGKSPILLSRMDLEHITAGSIFNVWKLNLSLGVSFTWGRNDNTDNIIYKVNSTDPYINNKPVVSFKQFSVLVGFSYAKNE